MGKKKRVKPKPRQLQRKLPPGRSLEVRRRKLLCPFPRGFRRRKKKMGGGEAKKLQSPEFVGGQKKLTDQTNRLNRAYSRLSFDPPI